MSPPALPPGWTTCLVAVLAACAISCASRTEKREVNSCTGAGCGGLSFALSGQSSSGSPPEKVAICHSEYCREMTFMRVEHDPVRDSRLWVVPNSTGVQWSEEHGVAYFSGWWLEHTKFRLPSERWTFRVSSADGSVLLERAATVTYRQAEINGPGCGVCTSARIAD
jgi:hypothetical protein